VKKLHPYTPTVIVESESAAAPPPALLVIKLWLRNKEQKKLFQVWV